MGLEKAGTDAPFDEGTHLVASGANASAVTERANLRNLLALACAKAHPHAPTPSARKRTAGELVLSSNGTVQTREGEWGGQEEEVAEAAWSALREAKQLLAPGETLKRITVSFQGTSYVVTGKESQYYVVRWS